jgi:Ca2+-binding RTX toxin-like protein
VASVTTTKELIHVTPAGSSDTGSTGIVVTATVNGRTTTTSYTGLTSITIDGAGANLSVETPIALTTNFNISAGDGNDNIHLGSGTNVVTLGNGNDRISGGNGNNTVAVGNGNDTIRLGNGNNVVVEGNGNDNVSAGNGDNLIVAGLGAHTVQVGNGSNILIDGSVALDSDALWQVLDDWTSYGEVAADVATVRGFLTPALTYNTSHANTLDGGDGLDWFWGTYRKDATNRKLTDLLN